MVKALRWALGIFFSVVLISFAGRGDETHWGRGGFTNAPTLDDQGDSADGSESIFQRTITEQDGTRKLLIDKFVGQGIPKGPLIKAFTAFDETAASEKSISGFGKVRELFKNRDTLTLVDVSSAMNEQGFWVLDLKNGTVDRMEVSHGFASDQMGRGVNFSNRRNSSQTSLGPFLTGQSTFTSQFGKTLALHGLSHTNSNAFKRKIWAHEYDVGPNYSERNCRKHEHRHKEWCRPEGKLDEGCFGIPKGETGRATLDRIKDGSLIYAFSSR